MLLSAAILAGGRATRFGGRDKSSLVVGGRSILEAQIAELSRLTDDILLVGGHAAHARLRSVADTVPGSGPLGGLHAALTEARENTVIVVACDMPNIAAPLLAYMAGLAGDADAVVPQTARGFHPLCAVYTRRCVVPIGRRLADGRLKMIEMLADFQIRAVTPGELDRFGDHDRLLANLNTPADYDR